MLLHYLVKYKCQKNWLQSEKCIVINDKSQDSTAKHLNVMNYFITNISLNLLVKQLF